MSVLFASVVATPLADPGVGSGVAWGDYDADGRLDLYLTNEQGENRLFHNEDGVFSDATCCELGTAGSSVGAAWADFDKDGRLDLFVINAGAESNVLYRNGGGGSFTRLAPVDDPPANSWGAAWIDYDLDGWIDLYSSNEGQPNVLLRNDGAGGFEDRTAIAGLTSPGNSQMAAWADYNNDGWLDLYLVVGDSANVLYENVGGEFVAAPAGEHSVVTGGQGAAWGDYDNDGDLDLYHTRWAEPSVLLRNNGDGTFSDVTTGPLVNGANGQSAVWADYDNDGDLDLYVANWGGPNRLLRNDGDGSFANVAADGLECSDQSIGAAWADYDRDGDLDLYLANADAPNRLFRNNLLNGNHWLQVELEGTLSNHDAVGARVEIFTSAGIQMREVSTCSGYVSQSANGAAFGLGSIDAVDSLLVVWPRRLDQGQFHTTLLRAVPIDTLLHLVEGDEIGVTAADDRDDLPDLARLYPCYPNPFNPATTIRFELPHTASVNLRVYDIRGRRVRTLIEGETVAAGRHEQAWNGRDDNGRTLPAGIYFCRFETEGFRQTYRMALVK
jgi:hypothetical protein